MKYSPRLVVLPLLLIAGCLNSAESSSSAFEGNWRYTQLTEDNQSTPACRWFHVITRRYKLDREPSGRYYGAYLREYHVIWLGPTNDCPEPARLENVLKMSRIDLWYLSETYRSGSRLNVQAEYDDCTGACSSGAPVSRQFRAFLQQKDGMLIDELQDEEGHYVFIPESEAIAAEHGASESMFKLIEPMYEGECNRFFENSLDPYVQATAPKAQLCAAIYRLRRLMPPILYHKPLSAIYFTFGRFKRMSDGKQVEYWGGRDVLVEQHFVVTPEGGQVPIASVLRRQPDGTWKVLVPTP